MSITFAHRASYYFIYGAVFTLLFWSPHAFASVYSVTPIVIDKELEKRDIIEETITITNKENNIVRLFPTVNEVSVDAGGTIQSFVEPSMVENKGTSVTSWIEIGRGRIELQPLETKTVTVTLRVNPEAKPGEYHAFVGFPEGSNRPEAEKSVINGNAQGTVIRIAIDQVQNQFLRLETFKVDRFVKASSEGEITLALNNPSDDVVTPKGEIIFYDNRGIEKAAIDINTENESIDPSTSKTYLMEVPNELKMGKYKAFLTVEYGTNNTDSINDTSFFYVLPLKQLIVIFAIILCIAILLALFVHRKYDFGDEDDGSHNVALFVRETQSESKEHDIILSKKDPT